MPKKPQKRNKSKEIKSIARERVGTPPPARMFEEKPNRTKPKHKKPIQQESE